MSPYILATSFHVHRHYRNAVRYALLLKHHFGPHWTTCPAAIAKFTFVRPWEPIAAELKSTSDLWAQNLFLFSINIVSGAEQEKGILLKAIVLRGGRSNGNLITRSYAAEYGSTIRYLVLTNRNTPSLDRPDVTQYAQLCFNEPKSSNQRRSGASLIKSF